ncbi:MAG: oligoendopeptidase F family protein, partial [Anaerolineales bacterium]|nr:oligoendopeptidase F family protein [Anaerolineales bacterium]
MSNALPKRQDVPVEHTWDLESVFATEAAWEAALNDVQQHLPDIAAFKGRLAEGPDTLLAFLNLFEKYQQIMGKVFVYAGLQVSTDTGDAAATARADRARGLMARMGAAAAFAQPELLAVGQATLQKWLAETPALQIYTHSFDQMQKQAAHIRSAEVEALLGQLQDPFRTASGSHGILHNSDIKFAPATSSDPEATPLPVAQSTYATLISHADRTVRRTAFENYSDGYLQFKNTLANLMATEVKQNVFLARTRGYGSALEAALAPSFLPTDVFHNTVNTFKANLGTWHRYWAIRRQALGYDKLHPYDTKAPLSQNSPKVTFQQAVDWISEGMKPLGDDYVAVLRRGCLEERWVDIYPNEGKRLGAFSAGVKGTHPFIFTSFTDDLFSMSTLAHELGHSLHSYYSRLKQPWTYARYTLFEAEVASNLNQALTRAYQLDNTDNVEFQIAIIEEAMSNFYRYFF